MTNLEKFKEVFGDAGNDVKAAPSWLAKEYNGPVKRTEMDKFVDWLETSRPLVRYELKDDGKAIYVSDFDNKPIIRVSDFCTDTESAYVRYESLCGRMPISKIKEIILEDARKSDMLADIFCGVFKNW